MSEYEAHHLTGVAELEAELLDGIQDIHALFERGSLSSARDHALTLMNHGWPDEFRMEGHHLCGIIDARDGKHQDALAHFEESRRIAINLEDYTHAAQVQKMVREVAQDPEKVQKAENLEAYYRELADSRPAPERFRRFEIGYD